MTDEPVNPHKQDSRSLAPVAATHIGETYARARFLNTDVINDHLTSILSINGQQVLVNKEEADVRMYAEDLQKTCAALIKLKGQVFQYKGGEKLNYCQVGSKFLKAISNAKLLSLQDLFPESRLNPFISMVVQAVDFHDASAIERGCKNWPTPEVLKIAAERLNQMVENIRTRAACKEFKAAMNNLQRGARKNRAGLHELVDSMFKQFARVLVVRVDLYYQTESHFQPANISCDQVKEDLRRLLKDMKGRLFKEHFITHVWKLEYGLQRGYHYHAFFFFDGSKVMNDVLLGMKIGEHWVKEVTEGRGSYFNCNNIKDCFHALGIGMIDHRDRKRIDHLKTRALEYLMKQDYYIKPMMEGRGRSFGKGALPKSPTTARGRPRKQSNL